MAEIVGNLMVDGKNKIAVLIDYDFNMALIGYMRYAMGQHTYIIQSCSQYIRRLLPFLPTNTLKIMRKELKGTHNTGGEWSDEPQWKKLELDILAEMNHRRWKREKNE